MTARFETQDKYPISAQRLFEAMTDPDMQRDRSLDLPEVLDAKCSRRDAGDDLIVIVLELSEKPRIGRRPERATMTTRWRPSDLSATWERVQHGHESRVRAQGRNRIVADGDDHCLYRVYGEVEIKIPLLGKRLEKGVAKEADRQRAHERRYICRRLSAP